MELYVVVRTFQYPTKSKYIQTKRRVVYLIGIGGAKRGGHSWDGSALREGTEADACNTATTAQQPDMQAIEEAANLLSSLGNQNRITQTATTRLKSLGSDEDSHGVQLISNYSNP